MLDPSKTKNKALDPDPAAADAPAGAPRRVLVKCPHCEVVGREIATYPDGVKMTRVEGCRCRKPRPRPLG